MTFNGAVTGYILITLRIAAWRELKLHYAFSARRPAAHLLIPSVIPYLVASEQTPMLLDSQFQIYKSRLIYLAVEPARHFPT